MSDHEQKSDESFSKDKSASRSRSRSATPVKRKKSKVSKSRSRTPRRRKHSKKYSPSRSRSRSYQKYSRSRSRGRRDSYDERRDYSRSRHKRSASRSPLSRRRRHRGDRENPKESKCIGVFGMSLHTDERTIRDVFERYGPIDEVQIVYDYHTGRSRGFAFVYYKYIDDAVDAKENAPGVEIDGHKIRVDYSITERAHTPTPGTYLGKGGYRGNERGKHKSPSPARRGGGGGRYRSYSRSPSRDRY